MDDFGEGKGHVDVNLGDGSVVCVKMLTVFFVAEFRCILSSNDSSQSELDFLLLCC